MTFRKELLPDVEANLLAIPRKQRAMVRKGINERAEERNRHRRSIASSRCTRTTSIVTARRRSRKRYFARLREVFGDCCEVLTIVIDRTADR